MDAKRKTKVSKYTSTVGEAVNIFLGQRPEDYHCSCKYCSKVIGEIRRSDGAYYSRLDRRAYYSPTEMVREFDEGRQLHTGGHIAKTPLHLARWAVQTFTKRGDWVLDPTIGSGTTAVEAMTCGRSAAGMELESFDVLKANVKAAKALAPPDVRAEIGIGDARNIKDFLDRIDQRFKLVVSNPPYSGDENVHDKKTHTVWKYDPDLPNLAFLRENDEYWQAIEKIYAACADRLSLNGHFVVGVKDQCRNWKPDMLHVGYCEVLERIGLELVGTAFLRHHPGTIHLNTYQDRKGNVDRVPPPWYQTISVFKKVKRGRK